MQAIFSKYEHSYLAIMERILLNGTPRSDRTGVGTTALFGTELVHDWRDGFPLMTHRVFGSAGPIGEMVCFIKGLTDIREFEKRKCFWWRDNLNDYNKRNGTPYNLDLGPIYGRLWRSFGVGQPQPLPRLPAGVKATVLGVANGKGTGVLQNDRRYRCWNSMIARCYDRKNKDYYRYGARGVYVCDRWLEFKNFYADMALLPGWNSLTGNEGLVIDKDKRPGANGTVYSPETCWWVTAKENANTINTRRYEVEKNGKQFITDCLTDFAKDNGFSGNALTRLFYGRDGNFPSHTHGFKPVGVTNIYQQGFDQLAWLLREAEANPTSRRLLVTSWDPSDQHKAVLPPCHYSFQIFIDGEDLDLLFNMRSVDWVLGCPADMAAYGFLQAAICRHLGKKPRELRGNFADTHIYATHYKGAEEILSTAVARPLPQWHWKQPEGIIGIYTVEPEDFVIEPFERGPSMKFEMAV